MTKPNKQMAVRVDDVTKMRCKKATRRRVFQYVCAFGGSVILVCALWALFALPHMIAAFLQEV